MLTGSVLVGTGCTKNGITGEQSFQKTISSESETQQNLKTHKFMS